MREYVIKRILVALLILYIIATLQFIIFQVISPIDPVAMFIVSDPRFDERKVEILMRQFGLLSI